MKNSQAQLDNLKLSAPYRFNSETGREAGKKGNPNSQEARRRNKTMAQFAKQIAEFRVSSANVIARLVELGITEEEANNAAQIVMGVFDHAIKGDIPAVDKWEEFLQRADTAAAIVIDRARTPHAYEEFVNYEYDRDRNGNFVSGYPDAKNHLIDATRYALERQIRQYRSIA